MKKFLAILLTILMLLPMFSTMAFAGTTVTPDKNADPGTPAYEAWLESEEYEAIDTYEELKAAIIDDPAGKYYLTGDITENERDKQFVNTFSGIWDGNGYTVYNWTNYIAETITGQVRNITFSKFTDSSENTEIKAVDWSVLGKIAGDGSVFENIINYREIANSVSNYYGVLIREASGDVSFINCKNYGSMKQSGGLNRKCGGFVGTMNGGTMTFKNCENHGSIQASQVGGFIGTINATATIKFENCINSGKITGIAASEDAYGSSGGFIGCTNNATRGDALAYDVTIEFKNCHNYGDVLRKDYDSNTRTSRQGGFAGYLYLGDNNKLTLSFDDCTVEDCTISGKGSNNTTQWGEAAGLVGKIKAKNAGTSITVKNCTESNVTIDANEGKFAFVRVQTPDIVTLENCVANNVVDGTGAEVAITQKDGDGTSVLKFTEESSIVSINKAQQSAIVDDASNVRFIGTVDGLAYVEIGYYIEYNGKTIKKTNNVVYKSLSDNFGVDSITAESLGAKYLTSIVMTDLPTSASGTINVTPYVKKADGTYIYGKTKGIEINSGEIGECL